MLHWAVDIILLFFWNRYFIFFLWQDVEVILLSGMIQRSSRSSPGEGGCLGSDMQPTLSNC